VKVTPHTSEELADILPAGKYPACVVTAVEMVSKAGNPMIVIEMEIYPPEGKIRKITDWLSEGAPWKVRNFCESVGDQMLESYERGSIDPAGMIHKQVDVLVTVEKSDDFGDRNKVKAYLKSDSTASAAKFEKENPLKSKKQSKAEAPKALDDDDIPF
jgi:hypothetical protein